MNFWIKLPADFVLSSKKSSDKRVDVSINSVTSCSQHKAIISSASFAAVKDT